ncbi:MAG: glycosyltransferase, partial [Flammeovirgaceae bacterium]
NKLFDFIQARLAIAIGPTPEMAEIVNKYDIGVVAEDFTPQALAAKLKSITPERISQLKRNTLKTAEELTAEKNQRQLQNLLKTLLT